MNASPRLASVVALSRRRPRRTLGPGIRSLGVALAAGAGITASVAAFGVLALLTVRHAAIALPAVGILATVAVWPAVARRATAAERMPATRPPVKFGTIRPARATVVVHPALRARAAQTER